MFIDKSGRDATIKQTVIDVTESYANMKFAVCFFYLAVTFFVPPTLCKTLPSFVHPCKRTSEDLSKCVVTEIHNMRSHLTEGIPEMGIPPMNRIEIPQITFDTGNSSTIINILFSKMVFRGAENFQVKDVHVDVDRAIFEMVMTVPEFYLTADYETSGRVILLEFNGKGTSRFNLTDVVIDGKWVGDPFTKDGQTYSKMKQEKLNIKIANFVVNFSNLFGDNKELNDTFNKFLNENANILYEDIKPNISDAIGQLLIAVINNVFTNYSLEQLFPPTE